MMLEQRSLNVALKVILLTLNRLVLAGFQSLLIMLKAYTQNVAGKNLFKVGKIALEQSSRKTHVYAQALQTTCQLVNLLKVSRVKCYQQKPECYKQNLLKVWLD